MLGPLLSCWLEHEERKRTELIKFLKANLVVFTWTSYEIPGIDPNFIGHELNFILEARPMKQRGRRFMANHVDVIIEEVEKLKEASAIIEVL